MPYQSVNIGDVSKKVLADQVTTDSAYVQAVKLVDATEDSETPLVFPDPLTITFAPSIGASAMGQLDSLHTTIITFAGAALEPNGPGVVIGAGLWDKDDIGDDIRLWLFSRSVTGTTQAATLSVSDADMAFCLGFIDFVNWGDGAVSRFAMPDRAKLPLPYSCTNSGTSLYGILQLIDSTTPTYTAGGLGGYIHVIPGA
jgi:hypothetical protein